MPKRIVIHAGFHKTGTTTIQKTLRENRKLLRPDIQIVLRGGMVALCEATRAYSVSSGAWDLGMVQYEAAETLQKFSNFDGTLLFSSEDLAGHMPGRRGLKSYAATPKTLQAIHTVLEEVFPSTEISFFFGTRTPAPWLKSCYVQHLRATRITQSVDEYAQFFKGSAQLDKVIQEVKTTIPTADVSSFVLDDCKDGEFGLLGPLLDHLNVAQKVRNQLSILPPANTAPPQAKMDRLLELNRSDLSDADLKVAKRALNQQAF